MPAEPAPRVLVVARDVEVRRRIAHALEADGSAPFHLEEVPDASAARERLRDGGIDVALVRHQPPDGLDAVRVVRSSAADVPVVALLATGEAHAVAAATRAGAVDSVVEERLEGELLRRTLRYAIERWMLEGQVHRRAVLDEATGVYNSRGFEQLATHHMRLADRSSEPVVLVFVRIDLPRGLDAPSSASLASDAAAVLREAVRDADVVGRLGPDTFGVLLSGDASGNEGLVLSRIVEAVATRNARGGAIGTLALTVGSARYDADHRLPLPDLIRAADERMRLASPS